VNKAQKICEISDVAEASVVCAALDEHGIPYTLRNMETRAYDGLFSSQGPWGFIEAPIEYADSIMQIVRDLRSSQQNNRDSSSERKGL
jgi:hypothetical protein